jgi:hypothetical protein
MNRSLMLSDTEREKLTALLRGRDSLLSELDALWKDDPERAREGDSHWSDETEEKALAVVAMNDRIVNWNDAHLAGKTVCHEDDGFPGAPLLGIFGGKFDPSDPDELPRWKYDGEDFLTRDPSLYRQFESPAVLLDEEQHAADPDYADYMRAIRWVAKHGWPPLTKKHRKNLEKVLKDLQTATHYVQDILAHG